MKIMSSTETSGTHSKAAKCDVCNTTLTYTLYRDNKETRTFAVDSGVSLDKHLNFVVNTKKSFQYKGYITAEVPLDDTGCRAMNPNPVRLPFDIEVCGLERVSTSAKGSLDFAFIAGVSADLKWNNEETLALFNITNSDKCPIKEMKLIDTATKNAEARGINENFANSILMDPKVNGTKDGLWIKNNIKVDKKYAFSLKVTTWGDVVEYQDFNIAWYVNKPPALPAKPVALTIDADYDNIQDGSEDNVFVFKSPPAVDDEKNNIKMSFSGVAGLPCQCMKVVQDGDSYKVIVYKEQISAKDVKTWTLKISLRDDKTMPFVKPNEYEQDIKINFTPTRKVEEVKKDETEVAKTTTCPGGAK
jgi:hypothetical protein